MRTRSLIVILLSAAYATAQEQRGRDTLLFRGLFSSWLIGSRSAQVPVWLGARYIPQLNYNVPLKKSRLLDFEGSVNLSGNTGTNFQDTVIADGVISPYRFWGRYSGKQFEVRLGLQKINFGSATMLRPLMWFDQVDPRDPLQLTNGVWGLLGRYYFLNNANVWLWALHGSDKPKTWETSRSNADFPELGGRVQSRIGPGDAGISYHHRIADTRDLGTNDATVPEHRLGLDGKWDIGIGLWFEAALIHKTRNVGIFTNQQIATIGADYTFRLGNGLTLMCEQFVASYAAQPLESDYHVTMTAGSVTYPVSMFDQLSALMYYDWINDNTYSFVNWKHQFNKFYMYLMGYWNPARSLLPQQQNNQLNLFAGQGVQVMLVYNH